MEARGTFLRVGLLIVAGGALLVGLLWFLGGNRISSGTVYESYFSESVQGLEVGVAVKYRGVSVGRVTGIGLATAEYAAATATGTDRATYGLVVVRYLVDPRRLGRIGDSATAVKLGLRARLASVGLTGVTYIELDFVVTDNSTIAPVPWDPVGVYIPSVPTTFSQVEDATKLLIDRLSKVDIVRMGNTANTVLSDVEALVRALGDQMRAADLPAASEDLRRTLADLRTMLQRRDITDLLAKTASAADNLARATAQLPPLIASIHTLAQRADGGVADTQQALVPLLRDMAAAVANLREFTDALNRDPAQILTGPPPRRETEGRR